MFTFPLQIHMLKPNPQGEGVWRGGVGEMIGHEDGALTNGMRTQETLECSLDPSVK